MSAGKEEPNGRRIRAECGGPAGTVLSDSTRVNRTGTRRPEGVGHAAGRRGLDPDGARVNRRRGTRAGGAGPMGEAQNACDGCQQAGGCAGVDAGGDWTLPPRRDPGS